MTNDKPNDEEISMMCDIAKSSGFKTNPRKEAELDQLVANGLIETNPVADAFDATGYRLTEKGQKLLDDLGIGITEL